MSTITREQLRARAREKVKSLEFSITQTAFADSRAELEEELELARIALASLEAEAVCVIDQSNIDYLKSGSDADVWPASRTEMGDVLLYRTAPPAPVSVPECFTNAVSALESLYRNGQKQNWNERYTTDMAHASGVLIACRAAMLQGVEQQNRQQNIPENIPTLRDGLAAIRKSGIAIDGEKILAERDALNSPVIPDGWVMVPVELTPNMREAYHQAQAEYEDTDGLWCPDHQWQAMLAAAPQQEVKP
ncbi:hypothetical protein [Enterobacter cloacae]|uniref:hypothetical protein n=1 Tax=Enterobacter cloacae TaxID=550 RepID=UPI003906A82F